MRPPEAAPSQLERDLDALGETGLKRTVAGMLATIKRRRGEVAVEQVANLTPDEVLAPVRAEFDAAEERLRDRFAHLFPEVEALAEELLAKAG